MRIIIYGAGAVGGVVAAALARSGQEVVAIARGARLAAIRDRGIHFRTPHFAERVAVPCVAGPEEIAFRPGDAVMLAMKTQDTIEALERLRAAGWSNGPVFCAQNGVANEEMALRRFPDVHGVLVMMPASFVAIDEANAYSTPRHGVFDVGRYPHGVDDDDTAMAAALDRANLGGFANPEVMAAKYGKLLMNLNNITGAAVGLEARSGAIRKLVRDEGEAALAAAGIAWRDVSVDERRDAMMRQAPIPGLERVGGSTFQSLMRGAGSVETDYLNGEIARLGRLHGFPTPANAWLCDLGARLARGGAKPGSMTVEDLAAGLRAAGADI